MIGDNGESVACQEVIEGINRFNNCECLDLEGGVIGVGGSELSAMEKCWFCTFRGGSLSQLCTSPCERSIGEEIHRLALIIIA